MNKQTLIASIAKKINLPLNQTDFLLKASLESIAEGLKKEGQVTLIGFGSFVVKKRTARKGRNPQTGESIKIPAKKVLSFRPGKNLKEAVNGKNKK